MEKGIQVCSKRKNNCSVSLHSQTEWKCLSTADAPTQYNSEEVIRNIERIKHSHGHTTG
jgi:hypothetical protein